MLFHANSQSMYFELAKPLVEPNFLIDASFDIEQNENKSQKFSNGIESMSGNLLFQNVQ